MSYRLKGSRMSKRLKTAAELVALLNEELRKQDACTWMGLAQLQTRRSATLGQPPSSAVRVAPCQDNARASSSRRYACFNSNTIWHLRSDLAGRPTSWICASRAAPR